MHDIAGIGSEPRIDPVEAAHEKIEKNRLNYPVNKTNLNQDIQED
jgi:hypothetical protein